MAAAKDYGQPPMPMPSPKPKPENQTTSRECCGHCECREDSGTSRSEGPGRALGALIAAAMRRDWA